MVHNSWVECRTDIFHNNLAFKFCIANTLFEVGGTGHIGFGLSVGPCIRSKHACHILWTVHARVLKFYIWIPLGNIADTRFFLTELSPFLELCPFEKIRMKTDTCHILWTVHARVLKFHMWIPDGKIAHPYFFLSKVSPFLELCLLKSEWNLVSKLSWKVFELGAWHLVSW